MCGIAGIYKPGGIASEVLVERMAQVLSHRGPDDVGVWADGAIALSHRRLSILDLSQAGHQPMVFQERGLCICYNGEVYNFLELRVELEELGYTFFSNTDTEVILKGYDAWGEDVFGRLRGMFALAIWHSKSQELILARDPFGIKPLYYGKCGQDFVFGSELKSLRVHPDFPTEIDPNSLFFYLRHLYVPEPRSIYSEISRLPAGHLLRINSNGQKLSQFYMPPKHSFDIHRSYEDIVEELHTVLQQSVEAHLISDVPLGVFLSGGVDSSAIVALMRRAGQSKIKTFTIGFEGLSAYDERNFARKVADHFETEHHEMVVKPDIAHFVQSGLIDTFDEPFANPAALIADTLSAFTRQEVTVALNGLGGDEFFAGYPRYNGMLWIEYFAQLPSTFHKVIAQILRLMPRSLDRGNIIERARRFIEGAQQPLKTRYGSMTSFVSDHMAKDLLGSNITGHLNQASYLPEITEGGDTLLSALLLLDQISYMPGDLLTYTDRTSMRHSLEVRVPFCDIMVADFASTIPDEYKIRRGKLKFILKDAFKTLVPPDVLYRKKGGFRVPINEWLCNELQPIVRQSLTNRELKKLPFFEPNIVEKLIQDFYAGEHQYGFIVWAILVLKIWYEKNY